MITRRELINLGFVYSKKDGFILWDERNSGMQTYETREITFDIDATFNNVSLRSYATEDMLFNCVSITVHNIAQLKQICESFLRSGPEVKTVSMGIDDFLDLANIYGISSAMTFADYHLLSYQDKYSWCLNRHDKIYYPQNSQKEDIPFFFDSIEDAKSDLIRFERFGELL